MAASDHINPQQFKLPLDYYREQQRSYPHDPEVAGKLEMPLDTWRKHHSESAKLRKKLVNDPMSGAHEL